MEYSVVIPSAGRPEFLREALQSVYAQTYAPAEVIIVIDGHKSPATDRVLEDYPQATAIVHDSPKGPAVSRQEGIDAATREWVCFLDDDDLWHREKQSEFFKYIDQNPACRAIRSGFWMWGGEGSPESLHGFRREIVAMDQEELHELSQTASPLNNLEYLDIEGHSLELMLDRNRGVMSSTMVHRDILTALPPVPAHLWTGQDWVLYVYIAGLTEWHYLPSRLAFIRIHAGQSTVARRHDRELVRIEGWRIACQAPGVRTEWVERAGSEYASELRSWIWYALRERRLRYALQMYQAAKPVLLHHRDRWSVVVPPPVVWRAVRAKRRISRWASKT